MTAASEPTDECLIRMDEAAAGVWNMAVDEALLHDAIANGTCWLRMYAWSEPTLSLGYFQKPEERLADPELAELPFVRRLSGGGAILHDDEWTYSCVVPAGHTLARNPLEIYEVVHSAIVATLRSRGAEVAFRREVQSAAADERGAEPFLCFGRGDPRDLVCRGHKVLGSAQRRRRGAVLQHGSLLLRRSPFAAEHPGLVDLVPGLPLIDLEGELAQSIGSALSSECRVGPRDAIDAASSRALQSSPELGS